MKHLFIIGLLLAVVYGNSQVKAINKPPIPRTGLESTNKGFLPPAIALNNLNDPAQLKGKVIPGKLVLSSGGTVADGYYFWDGSTWIGLSQTHLVTKMTSGSLLKSETFVVASGNITLTLPNITAADNGLTITVKNIGTHTDEVTIAANGPTTNDGVGISKLYRWLGRTFIAYNGNWIKKEKEAKTNNVFDVSSTGSWVSIQEAVEFLALHMAGPSVIRLSGETYLMPTTQIIKLPYPLTIEGVSYGATTISPGPALSGLPLFRCLTETYFKKIAFEGTLPYGNLAGEDAIQLITGGVYFEIKDCSFEHFNKTILLESNVELWLFETDITDAVAAGVEVAAGKAMGVQLTASECDFTNCSKGINLFSGDTAITNIVNCTFYNNPGQVGINYEAAGFTRFAAMFIMNNAWNNKGAFTSGFDFTLPNGRDANAFVQNNAGDGDKNPSLYLNVTNNATATPLPVAKKWYKINWDNKKSTSSTCKWTITNAAGGINFVNKISYQPTNKRDGYITISGNIRSNSTPDKLHIGIVKSPHGTSGPASGDGAIVRYGETTLRSNVANMPFQFSTVIFLSDIAPGDVFEIWANASAPVTITLQDIQMLVNTK